MFICRGYEHVIGVFKAYYIDILEWTIVFGIHLKTGEDNSMKLITLYLPETYIKALDQLVDERFYPNRAEAIRVAIRDLISAEVWRRRGVD
jgi:hypothetical protein